MSLFDTASFTNMEQIARIRTGKFQSSPVNISVDADTPYGVFGTLGADNVFTKATSASTRATHYLLSSDVPRLLASDISSYSNTAKADEPVRCLNSGSGVVSLQVRLSGYSIDEGVTLVVGSDGYATPKTAGAAFILGKTTQAVTSETVNDLVFVEVQLELPSAYVPS